MNPKEDLNKLIQDLKFKKFSQDSGKNIVNEVKTQLVGAISPILGQMVTGVERAVKQAIGSVKIQNPQVNVTTPPVNIPDIHVPTPVVNYTPPVINIPDIKMPEEMAVNGWINLMGYDKGLLTNPIPVQLRDAKGNPVSMGGGGMSVSGGGGKTDHLTIKGFDQSAFSALTNADGRLKVETNDSSISISDTLTVNQLSGANWSVTSTLNTSLALYNGDNRLRVSVETGGSGLTDAELRATAVPVSQLSGANWSVAVKEIFGSTVTSLFNGDNRLPVSVETGGSGLTDSELRATSVPVSQVSGSIWSTEVKGTVTVDGSGVTQPVSGTFWQATQPISGTVTVSDVTNSVKSALIDSSGVQYSGSNPVPVSGTVSATNLDIRDLDYTTDDVSVYQVSGHSWSTSATIANTTLAVTQSGTWDEVGINDSGNSITVDATDLDIRDLANATDSVRVYQLSGASWSVYLATALDQTIDSIATRQVSGFSDSVYITGSSGTVVTVGTVVSDAADVGDAPVKVGGIARQANPSAVAAGDMVSATYDDIGRQVTRPLQVRDLIATAYTSLTNGSETTLLAGAASTFHDLIYVMGANQSDAAVTVDLRCGTGGAVVMTLQIPASGTAGVSLNVPHKMPEVAQAWTADMPDITGTTVDLTAQFSKEI